jgi:hypothetical protein
MYSKTLPHLPTNSSFVQSFTVPDLSLISLSIWLYPKYPQIIDPQVSLGDTPASSLSTHDSTEPDSQSAAGQQQQQHAVRFASVNQEIEPEHSESSQLSPIPESARRSIGSELDPTAKDELRSLAITLQKSSLQEHRLRHFAFEPVSLPPSRVRTDYADEISVKCCHLILCLCYNNNNPKKRKEKGKGILIVMMKFINLLPSTAFPLQSFYDSSASLKRTQNRVPCSMLWCT